MLSFNLTSLRPVWRLKKTTWYQWLQNKLDITVYISIQGSKYKVAIKLLRDMTWIAKSLGLKTNIESDAVQDTILNIFKQYNPNVFWDIGSNIGLYSWLALALDEDREILMIDADKTNHELNVTTIKKNKPRKAKALYAAASNVNGTIDFLIDPVSGATGCINSVSSPHLSHSLHHEYQLKTVVSVNAITLDSLIEKGYNPPQFIKIDVEGAEHLVLEGGKKLIVQYKPVIVMETSQIQITNWLRSIGYDVTKIDNNNILCICHSTSSNKLTFMNSKSVYY